MSSETWPDLSDYDRALTKAADAGLCAAPDECSPLSATRGKYSREIKPDVWVDVYDVLMAFGVTNPADAHAIKKMLMPGKRGSKGVAQDRAEAIQSLHRAQELEQ